jgi:anti-anti-sigma factor
MGLKMAYIPLSLQWNKKDAYSVCTIQGDLTGQAISEFRNAVAEKLSENNIRHLLLELNEIHNFNSTALDTILSLQNNISREKCELVLIVSQPDIRELLDITCCSSFFSIYESLRSFELDHKK